METLETGRMRLPFGDDVTKRMTALLGGLGLELCHAEWKQGRSRGILTLTVDRPEGVGLADCEAASRAVEPLLEGLPELSELSELSEASEASAAASKSSKSSKSSFPGSLSLEVSSPGLDRPLWTLSDCVRFRGRRIRVQTLAPVEGTSRLKGTLESVDGDALTVLDEDRNRRYTVRFGDVKVARLVPEF